MLALAENENRENRGHTSRIGIAFVISIESGEVLDPEAVAQRCSVKEVFIKFLAKVTEKHLCQNLFFVKVTGKACNFI